MFSRYTQVEVFLDGAQGGIFWDRGQRFLFRPGGDTDGAGVPLKKEAAMALIGKALSRARAKTQKQESLRRAEEATQKSAITQRRNLEQKQMMAALRKKWRVEDAKAAAK